LHQVDLDWNGFQGKYIPKCAVSNGVVSTQIGSVSCPIGLVAFYKDGALSDEISGKDQREVINER